jgi:hypothetical protein
MGAQRRGFVQPQNGPQNSQSATRVTQSTQN